VNTNRLAGETSPYLLQHAHNPVDWYAWGPEAFERARREDRPIFLSVGYSTCYWCHVMERQSFESEAVAAVLNEHFVSVKVDREERPDVDQLYMTGVQVQTRHGGWPMSVFLTPDLQYFYGGTYFPPDDAYGRPGFVSLLLGIADAWKHRRDEVMGSARQFTRILSQLASESASAAVGVAMTRELIAGIVDGAVDARADLCGDGRSLDGAPPAAQPCGRRTGPAVHARRDNVRRDPRPARRGIPPVQHRREVARAALRDHAVRQRDARPDLRGGGAALGRGAVRDGCPRVVRLRAARADLADGRVLHRI
jgi:hypothetical protein